MSVNGMYRNKRQHGFSLVEMMIGLTIGLALLATLSYLLVRHSTARTELDQSMQQIENGRYAIQLLRDELRLAGFYGPSVPPGTVPGALPNPCAQFSTNPTAFQDARALPVQGYPPAVTSPIACLPDANLAPNADIVVVRRALTSTVALPPPDAGAVYLQDDGAGQFIMALGNGAFDLLDRTGAPAPVRPYTVHIYFVSPCDVPADGGDDCTGAADDGGTPIPTLKRREPDASEASGWRTVPLVQGVERFYIEYGVDTDDDGTPDGNYQTAAAIGVNPGTWSNVVAVRLHLLVRNTRASVDYVDEKSYLLGPVSIAPPGDAFKRHVFSETVRLINVSGRREG